MKNLRIKSKIVRLYKNVTILLISIFLLSACHSSRNSNSEKPYFFIQVSDPQLGFYPDSLQKEIDLYERAVREINRLKPDFVVITGDLVHNERDSQQLAEFKRITSGIHKRIPVYLTPGNHDVRNIPTKEDINFYKSLYGYDRFAFDHKKSKFIGINSNIIKAKTPDLEVEQYAWLEKELENNSDYDHTILFSHHPFFISKYDEPDQYFNINTETRKKYLALFKKYNVRAIFAGHYHRNGYGKFGDMEMVTTSAIGEPLGKDPSGFRIIRVFKDRIDHRYYSIDSIPGNVDLRN